MRTTVSTGTTHTFPSPIEKSKKELEISNAEYDIQECEFYVNPVLLTDVDIEPEFMKDAAGRHLFAPSSVVTIFGESGARKSFLLQTAVHDHCGIMVQLESTARGVRKRLGDLLSQSKKDGGIGLGTTTTSAIFLTIILGLVVYLTRSRKDAIPLDKALAD